MSLVNSFLQKPILVAMLCRYGGKLTIQSIWENKFHFQRRRVAVRNLFALRCLINLLSILSLLVFFLFPLNTRSLVPWSEACYALTHIVRHILLKLPGQPAELAEANPISSIKNTNKK